MPTAYLGTQRISSCFTLLNRSFGSAHAIHFDDEKAGFSKSNRSVDFSWVMGILLTLQCVFLFYYLEIDFVHYFSIVHWYRLSFAEGYYHPFGTAK